MSLKQIAQLTGTSIATVSRVLSNPEYCCHDKELTKRIRSIAKELNYSPNNNARELQRSHTSARLFHIDVLLARFDHMEKDPFFAELYRYVETELYTQGYSIGNLLTIKDISSLGSKKHNKIGDGLIILGKCPDLAIPILNRTYTAVIAIDRNPMNYKMDEVTCNGAKAAEMAVKYLIDLGHTRIAYVGDCTLEARYLGYQETLLNNKIDFSYEYVYSSTQTQEEGGQAFYNFSKLKHPPTAVFCANDITAIGFIKAMQEHKGKKKNTYTPAIISIDDIAEASTNRPMLSTIHVPKADMVHMAVLTLKDRLEKKHTEYVRLELPCRLMVRETTGIHI